LGRLVLTKFALWSLHWTKRGNPFRPAEPNSIRLLTLESARAILATHIIEAAKQGEHDQGRLRDGALVAWGSIKSEKLAGA
jgi:hypothetical protein